MWNRTTLCRTSGDPGVFGRFFSLKFACTASGVKHWNARIIDASLLPCTVRSQRARSALRLPRPVVEVRVPRGPGAVEGKRQLLVVLVFLAPHPKGGEHDLRTSLSDIRLGQQRSGRKESGTSDIHASRAGGLRERAQDAARRQEIARGANSGAAQARNHALEARAGRTLGGEWDAQRDSRRGVRVVS
jgi:hypothetical protein